MSKCNRWINRLYKENIWEKEYLGYNMVIIEIQDASNICYEIYIENDKMKVTFKDSYNTLLSAKKFVKKFVEEFKKIREQNKHG